MFTLALNGRVYAGCVKPLATEDLQHILCHTRPLWEEARGKRIFVSGGTGFFGAWLLESLMFCNRELNLDLSATVLTRDPEAFARKMPHLASEPSIQILQGDVRSFPFPEQHFEYIIHAAAPTSSSAADHPIDLLSTLLDGTERMLSFAKAHGTKKFLLASSGAVYGRQPENLSHIPESYLGGPDWLDSKAAYAEGKRICEQMCSLHAHELDIEFRIARCFTFVGPHLPLDQHFAIGNFIGDALAGRTIRIQGDGTTMRSYLYAADLAIWLWTLLFRPSRLGSRIPVFNVGSGEAISIRDLAQEVIQTLDPSLKVEIAAQPSTGAPLSQYVPDVKRAEAELELRQTISLHQAIRRTAAWYR